MASYCNDGFCDRVQKDIFVQSITGQQINQADSFRNVYITQFSSILFANLFVILALGFHQSVERLFGHVNACKQICPTNSRGNMSRSAPNTNATTVLQCSGHNRLAAGIQSPQGGH